MKMNDLIIYQIFPLRAFTDEETEHGILEAIDWIPHIKNIGANAVYFSPVFESSEHGYDTKNYCFIGLEQMKISKKFVRHSKKQKFR